MQYRKILYNIMSWATGKERRVDNLLAQGDWQFIQLGNYTSASPLAIAQGTTSKLSFQANNISYTTGRDLSINYNYVAQKFMPKQLNDVFLAEVRMKVRCSSQNGHFDVLLECPTVAYNPIQATTNGVPKSANTEQFVSTSVPVFIGQDIITNGLEVKVNAVAGNLQIYDVSFMVVRLTSGIANLS